MLLRLSRFLMRHNDVIDAGQNNRLFDPGTDMDWERLRLSHMQKGAYCKGTYYVQVCDNDRLINGHFHIGLVIIPRPPYWPEAQSRANMGRGMITRPIWKCPCIKLFITYFRHLEKRHPYWPETKSRAILARANMCLDMEMIL